MRKGTVHCCSPAFASILLQSQSGEWHLEASIVSFSTLLSERVLQHPTAIFLLDSLFLSRITCNVLSYLISCIRTPYFFLITAPLPTIYALLLTPTTRVTLQSSHGDCTGHTNDASGWLSPWHRTISPSCQVIRNRRFPSPSSEGLAFSASLEL